ncbi:MAG: hypothetical protein OHK0046_31940 [Anaerolineae bacterium]
MNKIIQIALNDLRITFRDNGIWLNLVVIPIILILVLGFVGGGFGTSAEEVRLPVDVIDNDQSAVSAQFLNTLREINTTLVLCPMDNDEEDICGLDGEELTVENALVRVEDNVTEALIEIPAGFESSVLQGEPTSIVYRSDVAFGQPDFIQQTVQAAVQRVGSASVAARVAVQVYDDSFDFATDEAREAFRQATYEDAAAQWSEPAATVSYELSGETTETIGSGFSQSVPGMGSMYVMFTVLAGVIILIQERKQWTMQRMITMPVTRGQIISGKMLGRFIMGMIQYSVAFGLGFLLGVNFGDDPLALLLVMVTFTLSVTALTLLLATVVKSEMQAASVTTFAALTLAPLGGAWWPLEIVPDFMKTVAFISPVGWAMDAFNQMSYYGAVLVDVLPNILVLLAFTAVFFVIGLLNFKYE